MKVYKYKGIEYSRDCITSDLLDLLLEVSDNEKDFDASNRGMVFTLDGEYVGNEDDDDLEDIVDKLIDYGFEIEEVNK